MKNKKLKSLINGLSNLSGGEFENISNEFASKVRGGSTNGTCNNGCNQGCNGSCDTNGACNNGCNQGCNGSC